MNTNYRYQLYGILGHPLTHTLSPAMQEAAFKRLRIPAYYLVFDLDKRDVKRIFRSRTKPVINGFNVTVPYKETVLPYMDRLTPEARAIGAVNTVVRKGRSWVGANTDAGGFADALLGEAGFRLRGKSAVLFGAGGSARAVLYALASYGVKKVALINRRPARAKALARRIGKHFKKTKITVFARDRAKIRAALQDADLVINATPLGLKSSDPAVLPAEAMPRAGQSRRTLFYDLIYKPAETPFLKAARLRGYRTLNGAGMLASQGARSLTLWTGRTAPLKLMRQTLRDNLKA